MRLGLDRGAHLLGLGGDARLLGLLLGQQHLDGLAPLGGLALARGLDALVRLGASARAVSASALAADSSSDFW